MYPQISSICLASSWRSPPQRPHRSRAAPGKGYRSRNLAVCVWYSCNYFLCFFKTFGSKKRVRHGISLRSIKKEIQNRLKTKKVRSSQSWSSIFFFENFKKKRKFSRIMKILWKSKNHDFGRNFRNFSKLSFLPKNIKTNWGPTLGRLIFSFSTDFGFLFL